MSVAPAGFCTTATSPPLSIGPIWRWTVEQYHTMIRLGFLDEEDPVELLDGFLVIKMPKNPPHSSSTTGIRDALAAVLPEGWYLRDQEPITLTASEPEPDAAVVCGDRRRYSHRHASPEDIALVVEVADSTLERDRTFKKRLYAEAGIAEYWIINLIEKRLEVYTQPSGLGERADYGKVRIHGPTEHVKVYIAGREVGGVPVCELLP